jgi:hypothetical protein
MPDCAAHYQFGQDVLGRLDPELKSCALAYWREYDMGLQGPDIFFFYQPYHKTRIADYGIARHEQPAIRMFSPILAEVRENAVLSYLMGLICHYTLDSCCHPYVNGNSRDITDHHRMEAAYDRHIITRHGFTEPRQLLAYPAGLDWNAAASLWPGMSAGILRKCLKSRRFYTRLLDHKRILLLLERAMGKRGAYSCMCLPGTVPQEQAGHVRRLDELYFKALARAPEKIRTACAAMGTAPRQLEGFNLNYEGEAVDEQVGEKLDPL